MPWKFTYYKYCLAYVIMTLSKMPFSQEGDVELSLRNTKKQDNR